MMLEKVFLLLTSIIALTNCQSRELEIRAVCSRQDIGNYIIKWETDPAMKGTVKIYVSDNPETFDRTRPVGVVNISDNITTYITNDNITRQYFLLSFNDRYARIVSSRRDTMDQISNFRDIGGYTNMHGQMVRWGKIYRSGDLVNLSERDSIRLSRLGIRTILDLRTEEEMAESPVTYQEANLVSIPVSMGNVEDIMSRLKDGRIRKGDGVLYMQDLYLQYVTDNTSGFSEAFRLLLDEENYPLLITSTFGKDKVGFLTALILSVLQVPEDLIYSDYSLSQEWYADNTRRMRGFARTLTPDAQEALTVMLQTNEAYLGLAFRKIRKEYGSVEKYLLKELNLTEKEITELKEVLLL